MFADKIYHDSYGYMEIYFVKTCTKCPVNLLVWRLGSFLSPWQNILLFKELVVLLFFFKLFKMVQKSWQANTFLKKSIFQ